MRLAQRLFLTTIAMLSLVSPGAAVSPDPFETLGLVRFDSGIRAPDFPLLDLKGDPVSVSPSAGLASIVVFWATW